MQRLYIVDAILSNRHNASVAGDFVDRCRAILAANPTFSVIFVKRDSNHLAHELARVSCSFGDSHCLLDPLDRYCGRATS